MMEQQLITVIIESSLCSQTEVSSPTGEYRLIIPEKKSTVDFNTIGESLNTQGCKLLNHQILFYSEQEHDYVYAGIYTGGKEKFEVPVTEDNKVKLKCRKTLNKDALFKYSSKDNKSRRESERRIGEVLVSVTKWKHLQGKSGENDEYFSLRAAAKLVGISKKTLEDYYKQIKIGVRHGFDFNFYRDSLMGTLRRFNTQAESPEKADSFVIR